MLGDLSLLQIVSLWICIVCVMSATSVALITHTMHMHKALTDHWTNHLCPPAVVVNMDIQLILH